MRGLPSLLYAVTQALEMSTTTCHVSQMDADNDLIGDPCDTNKDRYCVSIGHIRTFISNFSLTQVKSNLLQ